MSTTEIYGIKTNGDVVAYDSASNGFGGGMHVWNTLNEKYGFGDGMFTGFRKTWGNYNKSFYEKYEDVVLGSTFDKVIVLKDDIDKLIVSFSQYLDLYPRCNFAEQIDIFETMMKDDEVIGVAWCQTSVADDLWDFGYDEDTDELIPYNIFKGEDHWNLFDDINL